MSDKKLTEQIQNLEAQLTALQQREARKESLRNKTFRFSVISSLLGISLYTFGAVIANLHIFNDGEIISAQKINENFEYLNNKINQVSSGGTVSEVVPTFASIGLGNNENGKLYLINDSAEFLLPDITSVQIGYNIQFTVKDKAQARLVLNGSDKFQSFSNEDLMVLSGSGSGSSGYFHILSTGSQWIIKVESGGSRTSIESSKIYTANACNGKGTDINTSCYYNTTAMNTTNFGYTYIDEKVFQYSGSQWYTLGTNQYLIQDDAILLPSLSTSSSWDFNNSNLNQSSSFVYLTYSNPTNVKSLLDYNSSLYNHGGTTDNDYINNLVETNLYDVNYISSYRGSSCKGAFGKDWRLMTKTEAESENINISEEYWVSATGSSANGYIYMNTSGSASFETTDMEFTHYKQICIYDPI